MGTILFGCALAATGLERFAAETTFALTRFTGADCLAAQCWAAEFSTDDVAG
jgi:hypothetical protein